MSATVRWLDLVLDNGEIVRVELPAKYEDEIWQDIEDTMKRRDWWSVRTYDGTSAKFMGHLLERVNMARVVATL